MSLNPKSPQSGSEKLLPSQSNAPTTAWILPGTEAVITEIAPKEKLGEVTAVFDSSKDIGLMISPILGGVLADLSGNVFL